MVTQIYPFAWLVCLLINYLDMYWFSLVCISCYGSCSKSILIWTWLGKWGGCVWRNSGWWDWLANKTKVASVWKVHKMYVCPLWLRGIHHLVHSHLDASCLAHFVTTLVFIPLQHTLRYLGYTKGYSQACLGLLCIEFSWTHSYTTQPS